MAQDANYRDGVLPEGVRRTGPEGLAQEEAERIRASLPRDDARGEMTTGEILRRNLLNYFNLLNLALGACLLLTGSFKNMLFLIAVLTNVLIGTVQEIRARNTIRRLRILNEAHVRVIRGGEETAVLPDTAVPGDLAVFRAGDQVAADAMVTAGEGSAVESLLTGESDPVPKREGSWLYAGSYVGEGKLTAQIVYTGRESRSGRLISDARSTRRRTSRLMADIDRLIRVDSMILLPLGALLFLKQLLLDRMPIEDAVPAAVAAMVGMIPEGLVLLTSVALAAGVIRLGKRGVLVQELDGIESLARADVLCLDKTGTITKGILECEQVRGIGLTDEEAAQALKRFLGAFDREQATFAALERAVGAGEEKAEDIVPFSSRRKLSAALFKDGTAMALGAPEYLLGESCPGEIRKRIEDAARSGKRVLALVGTRGLPADGEAPDTARILALCVLGDALQEGIRDTMRYFGEEGVTVKVISGDSPLTASAVAREAGITGWDRQVDARCIETKQDALDACEKYTVFGRVTPEQKKLLIESLREKGHCVAMTGDGVNDVPALRTADCSISMAGGADAARHAAKMTMLDPDFSRMPDIVAEGRRAVNNITRAATLFLTKTLFSMLLGVLMLIVPGGYPFVPVQLTLVSMLTVGIPGLVLALEPDRGRIRGDFLRTVIRRALPGGIAVTVSAAAAMLLMHRGWTREACSTVATYAAFWVGYTVLLRVSIPMNRTRALMLAAMPAAFVLAAVFLHKLYSLERLEGRLIPAFLIAFAAGAAIVWTADALLQRIGRGRAVEKR